MTPINALTAVFLQFHIDMSSIWRSADGPELCRPFIRARLSRMRLQAAYDLKKAERDKKVMQRVARIVPVKPVEEIRA
jgi:hypothetical protein